MNLNTKTILKRLKDGGVEADPGLSREELIQLAATKGVSLESGSAGGTAPAGDASNPGTEGGPPIQDTSGGVAAGAPAGDASPPASTPASAADSAPAVKSPASRPAPDFNRTAAVAKKLTELLAPEPAPRFSEEEIREKTRVGLTRAQAVEVLTSQAEHDARLAIEQGAKG
jgi:hypothetical protein